MVSIAWFRPTPGGQHHRGNAPRCPVATARVAGASTGALTGVFAGTGRVPSVAGVMVAWGAGWILGFSISPNSITVRRAAGPHGVSRNVRKRDVADMRKTGGVAAVLSVVAVSLMAGAHPAHAVSEAMLDSLYIDPSVHLPAASPAFPEYDIDADCNNEFGDEIKYACVSAEKEKAAVLRGVWDEYRDADKVACQKQVTTQRHIQLYKNLAFCVDQRRYDAYVRTHPEAAHQP